ncbi:MAG: nucleotide exchange factor GrpE [Verrucomicrobia bacterium]|nr:nucleotide exchange factor GrpE [Verrucomicrobiota bacterium]
MPEPENTDPLNTTPASADPATNPAVPGPDAAQAAELATQLATAKAEAAANLDRYVRSVADLENFRRRTVKEKDELRLFAASRVLEDLLPVLDNLGLAVTAAKQPNADAKSLAGGVEMVLTQLKSALTNHGIKEINPAGQAFDANLHESISAQPSADVAEGSVLTVVRTGFSLNGRLLRPASVIVSSGPAKNS